MICKIKGNKLGMKEIDIKELKHLRENFSEPPDLCAWIRDNVPKSKLQEVKEFLEHYDDYFAMNKPQMIEHVYRGIKNSFKVKYAYDETLLFVGWLVYLLSPNKKEFDPKSDIESDLIQLAGTGSCILEFFHQNRDANSRIEKKGKYFPYYMFDKATLTFLGANVMFYYILTSVVNVIERSLTNNDYKFKEFLEWDESITIYVIYDIVRDIATIGKNVKI